MDKENTTNQVEDEEEKAIAIEFAKAFLQPQCKCELPQPHAFLKKPPVRNAHLPNGERNGEWWVGFEVPWLKNWDPNVIVVVVDAVTGEVEVFPML